MQNSMAWFLVQLSHLMLLCLLERTVLPTCSINSLFFRYFKSFFGISNSIRQVGHFDEPVEITEACKHFRQKLWEQGNILGSVRILLQISQWFKERSSILTIWGRESLCWNFQLSLISNLIKTQTKLVDFFRWTFNTVSKILQLNLCSKFKCCHENVCTLISSNELRW